VSPIGNHQRIYANLSIIAFLCRTRASSRKNLKGSPASSYLFSSTMGGCHDQWGWSCKGSTTSSRGSSNGHISFPGRSPTLCSHVVPTRFNSCKPASYKVLVCEVFHMVFVASCRFSNLDFFLLRFLALFLVI
jgi:hypothetical protein